MEIQHIPFSEIDKNKWNGLVYHAPNGHPFGFHWYLKSIFKSFDILIEGDYQSGMPLIDAPKTLAAGRCLPTLGLYSVNHFSPYRINQFYDAWKKHSGNHSGYPYNEQMKEGLDQQTPLREWYCLPLGKSYEGMYESYLPDTQKILDRITLMNYTFSSNEKPESLLSHYYESAEDKNMYYRIMYHALQRGIGFSSVVYKKKEKPAVSFFISSHNGIYEIYHTPDAPMESRLVLYDTIIRSNPNRVVTVYLLDTSADLAPGLGFHQLYIPNSGPLQFVRPNFWNKLFGLIKN